MRHRRTFVLMYYLNTLCIDRICLNVHESLLSHITGTCEGNLPLTIADTGYFISHIGLFIYIYIYTCIHYIYVCV